MDRALDPENIERALAAVIRNQGAPGIDGMTTKEREKHFRQHQASMTSKLRAGLYVPSPVRRKEIPKPHFRHGGMRRGAEIRDSDGDGPVRVAVTTVSHDAEL